MKKIFENNPTLIFIIPLTIFLLLGLVGLYFATISPEPVPFYGWIVLGGFILIPGLIIYSLTIGFEMSDKQVKAIEDRRESLLFDENGISIVMPLQAATWIIQWDSIQTITYETSDDDINCFWLELNKIPEYSGHDNPWWLAKLFPMKPRRKWVRVKSDARNFSQLPNAVKQYLGWSEHWKPNTNYASVRLLFDRQKRSLEDVHSSQS